MSYTPINWQTGDQITAAKLNKMDNGWSAEETKQTLCEESVTTVINPEYPDDGAEATLVYSTQITADTIIITFNNTVYTCDKINTSTSAYNFYGGFSDGHPDFTDYPFTICSDSEMNMILTETAGTYSIKIEAVDKTFAVSNDFKKAVVECVGPSVKRLIPNITTIDEATNGNNLLYFTTVYHGTFIVTLPSVDCTIIPESNAVQAHFGRDDGLFYFTET